MSLKKAKKYLNDVLVHQRGIPFRRFNGGVGRSPQGNEFKWTQVRWPRKSVKLILGLLQNAEANAEIKNLDIDSLHVSHVQVNRAPKMRRRTYRAHGRINPYMSSPCHVELILTEKEAPIKKSKEKTEAAPTKKSKKFSKKKQQRERLQSGGVMS